MKPQQFQLNVESNLILLHSKLDSKSRSTLLMLNTPTSQVRAQSQISLTTEKGKLFDRRQVQEKRRTKDGTILSSASLSKRGGKVFGGFWLSYD